MALPESYNYIHKSGTLHERAKPYHSAKLVESFNDSHVERDVQPYQ